VAAWFVSRKIDRKGPARISRKARNISKPLGTVGTYDSDRQLDNPRLHASAIVALAENLAHDDSVD